MLHTYKITLHSSFFPKYVKGVKSIVETTFPRDYVTFLDEEQVTIARYRGSDVRSIERIEKECD